MPMLDWTPKPRANALAVLVECEPFSDGGVFVVSFKLSRAFA